MLPFLSFIYFNTVPSLYLLISAYSNFGLSGIFNFIPHSPPPPFILLPSLSSARISPLFSFIYIFNYLVFKYNSVSSSSLSSLCPMIPKVSCLGIFWLLMPKGEMFVARQKNVIFRKVVMKVGRIRKLNEINSSIALQVNL